MRHPAAYPDLTNPREVRSFMHSSYARYVHGIDLFPRARVEHPENKPRKSRDIAKVLFNAWQVIDNDTNYFEGAVSALMEGFSEAGTPKVGQVVTRVGLNAVRFALVETPNDGRQRRVIHGVASKKDYLAEGGELPPMADGRPIGSYADTGALELKSEPDGIVSRGTGTAALFMADGADQITVLNRLMTP